MKLSVGRIMNALTEQYEDSAIGLLMADHRKVESLFSEFEKAKTARQRANLIKTIVTELTVHATVEEKLVYPLLIDEGELTKEAYIEHSLVKILLAQLAKATGSEEDIKARVKVLSELVKHHVDEEEADLLPKLKKCCSDMEALADRMKAEKSRLMRGSKTISKTASVSRKTTRSAARQKKAS
jgi:hemerythrin superfamily protein